MVQTGLLNSISDELGSASNNLVAFSQDGAGNAIDGKTFGTSNEVVVAQEGIGNITSFFQVGNANIIGVSQSVRS